MKYLTGILILVVLVFSQDVYRLNDSTFVYPCITTLGSDLNFVGLPLETGWIMASDIDPNGLHINSISRWNAEFQGWETAGFDSAFGWSTDFPIGTGGAYMINVKDSFDLVIEGDSVSFVYDLICHTDDTDLNFIIHPLTKSELTIGPPFSFWVRF